MLLGPRTVGSTSGFMGVATLLPGEKIAEHYHPYSEEFLYVATGSIVVDCDDVPVAVAAGEGLYIPIGARHRLRNTAGEPASVVFHLGPLAPRPELGHVDTENAEDTGKAVDTGNAGEARGSGDARQAVTVTADQARSEPQLPDQVSTGQVGSERADGDPVASA